MYILLFWSFTIGLTYGLPSMRDSLTNPIHVGEGDDALITCVVRDLGINTIMWKKEDKERHSMRVLTAGNSRVTADKRFSVLHDSDSYEGRPEVASGGDVWVLLIKNTKPTDSGIYVCEVNSNPIVRSFHKLSVITKSVTLPPNSTLDASSIEELREPFSSSNHNYTDCCVQKNVSPNCLGFCNIQSILEGSTGQDPENCEKDFPSIVKCMADGRNHVPCCIQERVPDICQDVCRGEYTAITDNIKTHFSCSTYTEKTLACIVEGIELLPSPPENVEVNAITEKSLNISWKTPLSNAGSLTQYIVNITSLHIFDPIDQEKTTKNNITANYVQVKVPSGQNFTLVNDLIPFTMYEITVIAKNEHGASLPSYGVRSLTLTPGKSKQTAVGQVPKLPDIKSCCANKGVSHKTCLNKLCDPLEADSVEITDLMICAPWAQDTFGCLTNGLDHTPCCKARGLPELCQQLCTGNVTSIDFNFFKCLRYMGEYTNCLLQGYGVLPGPPTNVHITNIETEFAIVHFSLPKTLGDTVTHYNIRIRSVDSSEIEEYWTVPKVQSPFVLEGLNSETDYEVYVEAVNQHGIGLPSSRITFRTESKKEEQELEDASSYNVTACCVEAEISSVCLPLCSYSANMSDIQKLAGICAGQFSKLLRCGAGGRNHVSCCDRRGVPRNCLTLCAGVIVHSLEVTATTCIPYIGNIAQCFEEGTGLLPGPVRELHATVVDDHSLLLEWEQPSDSNASDYVVHYNKVDNTSMHETPLKLDNQANTTETTYTILNLEKGAQYNIFVVSRNAHGTSLPSSIIRMTLIKADSQWVKAVTSAPHSLAVDNHSATWVSITWQPPEFSHPSELIKYTLYYKATSEDTFHELNTTVTAHTLTNLNPNTQYIVYVKAISVKGASSPSETLIAWTDPAYPAFVEPPTIHPINLVLEGSSMTVLCIAMGTPMPTISLYISGRLVRQDTTRHMVTVIHNVTKDMNQISCYADNGYGTPMQASKRIVISHLPHIQASGITMAVLGDTVTLECKVDAQPAPKMIFWRNLEDRSPVIQGGKYDINIHPALDDSDKFIMHLTIKQISNMDVGDYFCHAENAFGKATQPVSVRIRNLQPVTNVTQCCIEQNVTSGCMDACSFYLDIDAVIDKLACLNDFDKLMKCASDGSDHRNCCGQSNVPRYCLDWCRGEPVLNKKFCTLSYTKQIINCFHDGREKLPGRPQNVQIEFIDSHSVKLKWEPPVKNPHTVELYRVFWRPVDVPGKSPMKQDTPETSLKITELKDGATYECVIKAGNHRGTSTLTEPLRFTMGEKYVTSAASEGDDSSNAGVVVGIILALAVVAAFVVAAVWFIRTKNILGGKNTNGVAFENPSYLREVNMDHIQIPQSQQNDSSSQNSNGIAVSSASGGQGWKKEDLQVPAMQEVNPTLYEELKLGQDGAGFKRLKP